MICEVGVHKIDVLNIAISNNENPFVSHKWR